MDHFTSLLENTLGNGASLEEGLAALRAGGATPVDAIKAICVTQRIGLGEAKRVFGGSAAWAREVNAGNALHEEIVSALEKEKDL